MQIKRRTPGLAHPPAIRREKLELLFHWLKEWKFSTLPILAQMLESRPDSCKRFFRELRDEGWLKEFRNEHTGGALYLCLGAKAVLWAETWSIEHGGIAQKVDTLQRSAQVLHDLFVQQAVLSEIATGRYTEVFSEPTVAASRPDALLVRSDGLKIALEMERWQKNEGGMYASFYAHCRAIIERSYNGTIFYFRGQTDLEAYKRRFDEEEWPVFEKKKGRTMRTDSRFRPSATEGLRQCFRFSTLAPLDPPADGAHHAP